MKTKDLKKKLVIEKETVSNLEDLNEREMIRLKGGNEGASIEPKERSVT